jgi:hypothetical protein
MAGWYAKNGCTDFYKALWEDSRLAAELRRQLEISGAWRIGEAIGR